jgi:polyketide synthase PksN
MQIKYKMLVPSLHSRTLNPYIDFTGTPFCCTAELSEWKRPVVEINGISEEYPRIAGISSFGAGGSNAHIVIEEYIPKNEVTGGMDSTIDGGTIIVLSAKDEDRLNERVRQLLETIRKHQFDSAEFASLAYTLQVGREAMEERLALFVKSPEELDEKLENYLEEKSGIKDLYRGQVRQNRNGLAAFSGDEDLVNIVEMWIDKGKYSKLLEVWVNGLNFDWNRLYGENKPNRLSLPTYPFKNERYWAQELDLGNHGYGIVVGAASKAIHPLLHQNTSDLAEQRFSSVFTGQEFFLSNHKVKGLPVLPGAACLEMAMAAVNKAAGFRIGDQTGIKLKNIVWARPVAVVDKPVEVHIGLFPESNGEIDFEIYSGLAAEDAEPVIYCQGSADISGNQETAVLDINSLKEQCSKGSFSSQYCYELFNAIGFEYGNAYRGIVTVYKGENQVLAELSLPECVSDGADEFIVHPSLIDSALQASIGLMMDRDGITKPDRMYLPFALKELKVFSRCTSGMWAYIRKSEGIRDENRIQELDIDLCDMEGKVCIQMRGYSSRLQEGEINLSGAAHAFASVMMEPFWTERAAINEDLPVVYDEHIVFLSRQDDILLKSIETEMKGVRCITAQYDDKSEDKQFEACALQLFREINRVLGRKQKG